MSDSSDPRTPHIVSATTESFRTDVMEASLQVPVVADFWADWCAPCRQLMPILEKLAEEYGGRFRLVKINVDECPEIAGAFGIQSIPFVVAFVDGQPVSQLPGAHDEASVRSWLDSFLPSPATEAYNSGLAAEADGRHEEAETAFRSALEAEPDRPEFSIALARVLLAQERVQECSEIIQTLEARGFLEPEAQSIRDQLNMLTEVSESGGTRQAREALAADPDNAELQIRLAEALSVDRSYEEACELLLNVIRTHQGDVRDRAKDVMVTVLAAMGPKSRLGADYRRRLATAYY